LASGVAARSMAVADGGRRLRQWSARSMRVTPSCPRPSAAPIARARGRSVEGTCVGRGATATRGRGRRGRALIVRAPSKPAGEFANAPLHRLGCSLGSAVRHGRGLGLAARGTSGRAVWSCVRRRRPRGHWRAVIMVSYRNGVCPRAAFVARLDMARFTRVRVLRWVQHSRPVQLVLLPCGVHRTAACEWRASGRGTWKMAWGVREAISSKQPQVGWPWRGGELGLATGVATGGRCERHVRRCV
jgi:hypothetical protein